MCMCVGGGHTPPCIYGGQRTAHSSQTSPSTIGVLGMSWGPQASQQVNASAHWTILLASLWFWKGFASEESLAAMQCSYHCHLPATVWKLGANGYVLKVCQVSPASRGKCVPVSERSLYPEEGAVLDLSRWDSLVVMVVSPKNTLTLWKLSAQVYSSCCNQTWSEHKELYYMWWWWWWWW